MRTDSINSHNLSFTSSWYDRFFKSLPEKEIKNTVRYNKFGTALASPHWNRVALGIAAITTQPAIDYFNPRVNKDTATASALRTIAKILVCTSVGFCVRGGAYKLVKKYAKASAKEGSTILTPEAILKESDPRKQIEMLKLHHNALSTVTALSVMLFTNFLLDAPLTTKLANKFIASYYAKTSQEGDKQ